VALEHLLRELEQLGVARGARLFQQQIDGRSRMARQAIWAMAFSATALITGKQARKRSANGWCAPQALASICVKPRVWA